MAESRRDLLIEAAVELFYKNGYHATGIEKILTESGVSKPTLYRHFPSKDDLIVAALQHWDQACRGWLKHEMAQRAKLPRDQLLALFDALEDWFGEAGYQGCMFINATVEFPDQDNPIHRAAAVHKAAFAVHLRDLAAAAGTDDPAAVTEQLMILMEGAIVVAHTTGDGASARQARELAEVILERALA